MPPVPPLFSISINPAMLLGSIPRPPSPTPPIGPLRPLPLIPPPPPPDGKPEPPGPNILVIDGGFLLFRLYN